MSKFNAIQSDFTGGEISPKCFGRVDLQKYAHAAALMRNFTISPQGGAIRRTGSRFVSAVPNSVNFTRLIEFRFATTDACVIELSNTLIRFYANQGLIVSGGSPYSITSPYASADLPAIKATQSASIIYLFHPSYPTQVLSRFGDTNWTIANIALQDGPYLDTNYVNGITLATAGTTLTPSVTAAGASGTLTASTNVFVSTDVGRAVRLYNGSVTSESTLVGWVLITAYTSPTVVNITVQSVVQSGAATLWNLGAICATTGYASCGTFWQQRLVMGNTPQQPATFFMSASGSFYNFAPSLVDTTVTDASAITYTIASDSINSILWFSPSAVLMIGTDGAEWQVASTNYNTAPVTPTNIDVALQTSNGSQATCRSLRVGWETIYVARTGRDVFKMVYEFQVQGFQSLSLSLLGEHILREGNQLVDLAYQQFPHSILWFPRESDGALAGLTYLAEQQVMGWHLHTLGGTWNNGTTNVPAVVESVACIPTPDGTKDQLWMVVKRTVNGNQVRYVEYFESPYELSDTPQNLGCFVDCAPVTYNGSPATTISGLSHLIGQEVSILADGSAVDNQTVNGSGEIILAVPASIVTVGLPYTSTLKVLPLEGGGSAGTGQGKLKRTNKFVIRVCETLGYEWSVDGVEFNTVDFRTADMAMGLPVPLQTNDLVTQIDMPVNFGAQYWVQQTQPYPLTVLALMPESMVYQ